MKLLLRAVGPDLDGSVIARDYAWGEPRVAASLELYLSDIDRRL